MDVWMGMVLFDSLDSGCVNPDISFDKYGELVIVYSNKKKYIYIYIRIYSY